MDTKLNLQNENCDNTIENSSSSSTYGINNLINDLSNTTKETEEQKYGK